MAAELNMSLEYLPITKELKDVSNLKNKDVWIEQSGLDQFDNPRFQLDRSTTCTMQTTKNGRSYVAFVRVSELVDGEYNYTYFKSFSPREEYSDSNDAIYFEDFREWGRDPGTGRWAQKDN